MLLFHKFNRNNSSSYFLPTMLSLSSLLQFTNTINLALTKKQDCTYNHFQSSSNCPRCGRILGENDFTEIMVSDPDSKFATNPDEVLQSLLTKTSNQSGAPLTWNDMCAAMIREQDAILANTRFFVKVSFTRACY